MHVYFVCFLLKQIQLLYATISMWLTTLNPYFEACFDTDPTYFYSSHNIKTASPSRAVR